METGQASSTVPEGQRCSDKGRDDHITVGERIDRICDSAHLALKCGNEALGELRSILDIDGRVDRNPYSMMAAAAGSGYVLGGGLFSPLTARIVALGLHLGVRLAAIPLIQHELLGFAQSASMGGGGSRAQNYSAQDTKVTNQGRCCDEPERTKTPGQGQDS